MEKLEKLFEDIIGEISKFADYNKIKECLTDDIENIEFGYYFSREFQEVTFSIHYFEEIPQKQDLYFWNLEKKEGYILFDILDVECRNELEKILLAIRFTLYRT